MLVIWCDMISDFLRQSNDLRAEIRTRLLSLGLMQCKSYIVLRGKHGVYMRSPSHKKGSPAQAILGPLRLTLVRYELFSQAIVEHWGLLIFANTITENGWSYRYNPLQSATIRYNPLQSATIRYNPLHHHMGPHRESTQEHKSKRLRPSKEVRQFFPEDSSKHFVAIVTFNSDGICAKWLHLTRTAVLKEGWMTLKGAV